MITELAVTAGAATVTVPRTRTAVPARPVSACHPSRSHPAITLSLHRGYLFRGSLPPKHAIGVVLTLVAGRARALLVAVLDAMADVDHQPGSKISYATVDVSVPELLVIVKLVPATRADTRTNPGVPPSAFEVTRMREFAVTAVLATVTVPATRTAV